MATAGTPNTLKPNVSPRSHFPLNPGPAGMAFRFPSTLAPSSLLKGVVFMRIIHRSLLSALILGTASHSPAMAQDRSLQTPQSKQISELQQQIALLEQKVNKMQQLTMALSQIIQISGNNVEINALKNLTLKAGGDIAIHSSNATTLSSSSITNKSNAIRLESASTVIIKAAAPVSIQGTPIRLNNQVIN